MTILSLVFLAVFFHPTYDSDSLAVLPFGLPCYFALIIWLLPSLTCLVCWLIMLCSDEVPSCAAFTSTCFILRYMRTPSFLWHVGIFCFNFVMVCFDARAVFIWYSVLYGVVFGPLEYAAWYFGA